MTEDTFTRELERRAEDVHGAPFALADIRGKARSIRRRRRLAVGTAAAAAVAAIVVPMGIAGGSDPTGPEPAPSPTVTPPSPDPNPTEVPGTALTPASAVLHDGVLTLPDGSTVPLDVDTADLRQLGVLADGRIVVPVPGIRKIRVYGADGRLDTTYDVDLNEIKMSADHTLVAWFDTDLRPVVLESGVAEPTTFEWGVPMPGEAYGSIDGLYGSDCANGGCTLLVGDHFVTTHVLTSTTDPADDLRTSEPMRIKAVNADQSQWAVEFPADIDEQFGCSGLYQPAGTVTARSCDTTLWSFSPDGTHVIGARGDNGMWGSLEVLDRDLRLVLDFQPDDGLVVKDWGWADADHLYVVVAGIDADPQWSLLRVPIDGGEPEVLEGPVSGPNPEQGSLFVVSD